MRILVVDISPRNIGNISPNLKYSSMLSLATVKNTPPRTLLLSYGGGRQGQVDCKRLSPAGIQMQRFLPNFVKLFHSVLRLLGPMASFDSLKASVYLIWRSKGLRYRRRTTIRQNVILIFNEIKFQSQSSCDHHNAALNMKQCVS